MQRFVPGTGNMKEPQPRTEGRISGSEEVKEKEEKW